jgi:hypothetical protein
MWQLTIHLKHHHMDMSEHINFFPSFVKTDHPISGAQPWYVVATTVTVISPVIAINHHAPDAFIPTLLEVEKYAVIASDWIVHSPLHMALRKFYLLLQCIETSKTKSTTGSSPLMREIENRPPDETMSATLAAFKTAANIPDNHGESPLQKGHQ